MLSAVLTARPNVDEATFERDGLTFEVRNRDLSGAGEVKLHIATFVKGARRPISTRVHGVSHADLGEADPPKDAEFTDVELAIVVRPTMLAFAATGLHGESRVRGALRGLLELAHPEELVNRLALTARADKVGKYVGREIMSRLTKDNDGPGIDLLDDIKASLVLKLRKRKPTLEQINSLTTLATDVVDEEEQFKIRTLGSRVTFTRDKLLLHSVFNQANAHRLDYLNAWAAGVAFLNAQA